MKRYIFIGLSFLFSFLFLASCKKDVKLGDPPYPDGAAPEYKFETDKPVPSIASAGTEVTYKISGLKGKEGKFKFFISNVEAEVITVTDNTITIKVPPTAISGNASLLINENYFYGPLITIKNDVEVDPNFSVSGSQSIGTIMGITPIDNNSFYIYGSFNNFAGVGTTQNPIRGIVAVNLNGQMVASQSVLVRAITGEVNSILKLSTNEYLISGGFSSFDTIPNVNGLARVSSTGALQTMVVNVVNPDPVGDPGASKDTVSALNAGVSGGSVLRTFETDEGQYIVVGNFDGYVSTYYDNSTKTSPYFDNILAPGIFRINSDGSYDSTFNYNFGTKRGYPGPNGKILDAIQLPGGDILMVGSFTTYNGVPANHIVKIRASDGKVDASFTGGGAANGIVNTVNYNKSTGKILIAGAFNNYNGTTVNGVVMINEDGSIDPSFNFKPIMGGIVNYASQINYKGLIIVSGGFTHYGGQVRPGIAILNSNGDLAAGYNNFGLFRGQIYDVYERLSDNGYPSVFLVGSFNRYDNLQVGNFVKLNFKN